MNEQIRRVQEERAALWDQMKAIYADAEGEQRLPTAAERERWDKLNAELNEKTRALRALEAHSQVATELETIKRDARLLPGGDRAVTQRDLRPERDAYESVFVIYLRYGPDGLDAEQRQILRAGYVADETRVQNKGTTTAGGFTVPQDFYDQLVVHLVQAGAMRQTRATVITSAEGRDLPVPKTTAHGAAAWIAESGPITAADETFGQVVLKAYKAGRSIRVSNELLTDTGVDLVGYLAREFGRSIGALENTGYVVGVGTTQPTGITTLTTLGKTGLAGQTTSVITDDLFDLYYSVSPPYRRLGEWLMNDGSLKTVRKLKDSTGQFLWQPGLAAGEPDMLLGKPVYSDPDMPAMGVSAKSIIFGDLSTYFIRDVGQLTVRRSDEIYIATDEVGFFGLHRTDGNLIDQTGAVKHYANSAT